MSSEGASAITYDRQLLLLGSKRNVMLDLSEVLRYGIDSYGDADYVSIYGLPPVEWYGKGIRLLGRTAVECTRDQLANAIGREIAAIDASLAEPGLFARDPARAAVLAKGRADAVSALARAEDDWLDASAAFESAMS